MPILNMADYRCAIIDDIIAVVESERAKMSDEDFLKRCFAKKVWTKGLKKNELIRFKYLRFTPIFSNLMPM